MLRRFSAFLLKMQKFQTKYEYEYGEYEPYEIVENKEKFQERVLSL